MGIPSRLLMPRRFGRR